MRAVLVRIGKRARDGRKKLKLTQEQAAERMGLDEKHLQLIETGQTNPTVATLVAVARGLGVEVSSLLRQRA